MVGETPELKEAPKMDAGQQAVDIIVSNPDLLQKMEKAFPNPDSRKDKPENMDAINQFSVENKIAPNALLAFWYKEEATTDKTNKATETNKTAANTVIQSTAPGTFEKEFQQVGKLESNPMTGAILDFTGSMSKDQIQAMITTMRDLSTKGIITEKTTFNVMYDITDQDDEGANSAINTEKLKDTDQKINAIEFGKDGAGLKNYLVSKGLINDKREVQKNGVGSTPLYTTILENLMHGKVKDVTIFTDGASDRSANQAIGPEEVGNEESWDAMINICKTYDKKINIVAFNIQPQYLERTTAMQDYFKAQGAEDYINVINLGEQSDATLSKTLTDKISNNYEIAIKEDQTNMVDGKKTMTIDNTKNTTTPNKVNTPTITNEKVKFAYDEKNTTYEGNLGDVFPGVDLSQYTVDYTINSSAKIEQTEDIVYPETTDESHTYILDVSTSMNTGVSKFFKKEKISTNPNASYQNILSMTKTIKGFKYDNAAGEYDIKGFGPGEGGYSKEKMKALSFDKPDYELCGLVLKAGKDYYNKLLTTIEKGSTEYKEYMSKISEIDKTLLSVNNMTNGKSIEFVKDANILKIYNDLKIKLVDKQEEIKSLYGFVKTVENIGGPGGNTPIFQTISRFEGEKFSKDYAGKTVEFFTDFGQNIKDNDKLVSICENSSEKVRGFGADLNTYARSAGDKTITSKIADKYINNTKNPENNVFDTKFVKDLQANLLEKNITIDFKYYETYEATNPKYQGFLRLLGEYMNQKSATNPDGKTLFKFTAVPESEGIASVAYGKVLTPTASTYERNSITFKLTPKAGSNAPILAPQTVGITPEATSSTENLVAQK